MSLVQFSLKNPLTPIVYSPLASPNHLAPPPSPNGDRHHILLMLYYNSSITLPDVDDISIAASALQNASADISYTCTVMPLPSSNNYTKSGTSGTRDLIGMQVARASFVASLVIWVLACCENFGGLMLLLGVTFSIGCLLLCYSKM